MTTVNLLGGIYPATSSGTSADPYGSNVILETYGSCGNLRGIGTISSIGAGASANLSNNSLDFSSTAGDTSISYGTNASYSLSTSWTLELKVSYSATSVYGDNFAFLVKGNSGMFSGSDEYAFGYSPANLGYFYASYGRSTAVFSSVPAYSANTDYYVAFLSNAGTISLYVNGTSYSPSSGGGNPTTTNSSYPLYVGGDHNIQSTTNGKTLSIKALRLTNALRTISTSTYPLY